MAFSPLQGTSDAGNEGSGYHEHNEATDNPFQNMYIGNSRPTRTHVPQPKSRSACSNSEVDLGQSCGVLPFPIFQDRRQNYYRPLGSLLGF